MKSGINKSVVLDKRTAKWMDRYGAAFSSQNREDIWTLRGLIYEGRIEAAQLHLTINEFDLIAKLVNGKSFEEGLSPKLFLMSMLSTEIPDNIVEKVNLGHLHERLSTLSSLGALGVLHDARILNHRSRREPEPQ